MGELMAGNDSVASASPMAPAARRKPGPKPGAPKSQAHRDAIAAGKRGKPLTEKHKAAVRANHAGRIIWTDDMKSTAQRLRADGGSRAFVADKIGVCVGTLIQAEKRGVFA